ncbi:MAG TPA: hypothetical protein VJQ77_00025 [Novosphingobium sp.]|nr:hypothetical protein [Novosphingobium sp.]
MQGNEEDLRGEPQAAIAAIMLAVLASAIAWTALHRGPWYDEFYTQYVTRPGLGWTEALTTSWLADNHPPFFYILMRATAWFGGIEAHRLFNLAVATVTVAGGWITVRRERRLRVVAVVLALLVAANPWTMMSATELRSYFISLCAGMLLSLVLAIIWIAPLQGGRARQVVYAVTAFVAFNTHIVTTLFCAALIVPFAGVALLRRDRVRLRALLPAPIAAGLVFTFVTFFQFSHWDGNTQVFWLPAGLDVARWAMEFAVQRTLFANLPILLGAVAGVFLLGRDLVRTRSVPDLLAVILLTGSGIALAFALLLGIQMIRPIIIEKYLTAAVGAVAVVTAIGCSHFLVRMPRWVEIPMLVIALAASCFALAGTVREAAGRTSWMGTGRLIARVVASCPDATVHTDDFWNADVMAMPPSDNRRVAPWAYDLVARRLAVRLEPVASRKLSPKCPNLFWAEHDSTRRFDAGQVLRHLQQSGFPIGSITLYRVGDGWVASDRPLNLVLFPRAAKPGNGKARKR